MEADYSIYMFVLDPITVFIAGGDCWISSQALPVLFLPSKVPADSASHVYGNKRTLGEIHGVMQ